MLTKTPVAPVLKFIAYKFLPMSGLKSRRIFERNLIDYGIPGVFVPMDDGLGEWKGKERSRRSKNPVDKGWIDCGWGL